MYLYKVYLFIRRKIKLLFLKNIYSDKIAIGKNVIFRRRFDVLIEDNGKLLINDNCFFNNDCSINIHSEVVIGENCIFGEGVKIYDHNHIFEDVKVPISIQGFKSKKITIGENCWIGSNVIILSGVTIGDNVIIGAGCTIYKDVQSDVVVKNKVSLVYEERR